MAAGKRIRNAYEGIDRDGLVSVEEAVSMVKSRATAKFDETIEISMNLGIPPSRRPERARRRDPASGHG